MAQPAPADAVRAGEIPPCEATALRAALGDVVRTSGMPIAFGGVVRTAGHGTAVTIRELIGTRTPSLRGLEVRAGAGLGGRVLAEGRIGGVENYGLARGISHDYDGPVLAEGLCTVAAVPVLVSGRPRAVLYAASREGGALGDRVRDALVRAAARMSVELGVRGAVDQQPASTPVAATAARMDVRDPARWEEVRAVHSDLRLIAQELPDEALRQRLHAACARLAALGGTAAQEPSVQLAPRETDVLAMVALGCSNAETARRLAVRPETVKSYLRSAMSRLDAHTRYEAVVRARGLGLLP